MRDGATRRRARTDSTNSDADLAVPVSDRAPAEHDTRKRWDVLSILRVIERGIRRACRNRAVRWVAVALSLYIVLVLPFRLDVEEAVDFFHDIAQHHLDTTGKVCVASMVAYEYTGTATAATAPAAAPASPAVRATSLEHLAAGIAQEQQHIQGGGHYTLYVAEDERAQLDACSADLAVMNLQYVPRSAVQARCGVTAMDRPLYVWARHVGARRHAYHGLENLYLVHASLTAARALLSSSQAAAVVDQQARIFAPTSGTDAGFFYTSADFGNLVAYLGAAVPKSADPQSGSVTMQPLPLWYPLSAAQGEAIATVRAAQLHSNGTIPLVDAAPHAFCASTAIFGRSSVYELYWKLHQTPAMAPQLAAQIRAFGRLVVAAAVRQVPGTVARAMLKPTSSDAAHVVVVLREWGNKKGRPDLRASAAAPPAVRAGFADELCAGTRRFDNEEDIMSRLPALVRACAVTRVVDARSAQQYLRQVRLGESGGSEEDRCGSSDADAGAVRLTFVRLGLLPFEYQVLLVRSADVVVGVHGAGLVHTMWMRGEEEVAKEPATAEAEGAAAAQTQPQAQAPRPPSTLVELHPQGADNIQLYSNIASLAGVMYRRFVYQRRFKLEQRMLVCERWRSVREEVLAPAFQAAARVATADGRRGSLPPALPLGDAVFFDEILSERTGMEEDERVPVLSQARTAGKAMPRSAQAQLASLLALIERVEALPLHATSADQVVQPPLHPVVQSLYDRLGAAAPAQAKPASGGGEQEEEEELAAEDMQEQDVGIWAHVLSSAASLITPGEPWRRMVKDADSEVDVLQLADVIRLAAARFTDLLQAAHKGGHRALRQG